MKNLVKMTRSAYSTARSNRTLVCPNVALITDENNKVEYLKMNPTTDIGIASWEGGVRKFYSLHEWNALATKPTALGVYVFTEDAQFIIHGTANVEQAAMKPDGYLTISGLDAKPNLSDALLDFNGQTNSQLILTALANGAMTSAPAFTWADELATADGSRPYIPSLGELSLIYQNRDEINTLRGFLNQAAICDESKQWKSRYWSSTLTDNQNSALWSNQDNVDSPYSLTNHGVDGGNGGIRSIAVMKI